MYVPGRLMMLKKLGIFAVIFAVIAVAFSKARKMFGGSESEPSP